MRNYKSNINKLYFIKTAKWFMLYMPIIVPFYKANDLGMRELLVLQAIYSISIVVLEIPSGYFADVLGRKNTIIIGSILGFFGFLTYSLSYGFVGFLIAEVILGLGQSFISGSDSAMLYDTLKEVKKEKEYSKYEGRVISVGNIAEAAAAILGSLLTIISIRTPYYFQTGIAFIAIPAAFLLYEPNRQELMGKMSFKEVLGIVKHSLIDHKILRWNIIYSSIIGASTLTMAYFAQAYCIEAEIKVSNFGYIWAVLNVSVAISALYAYKLDKKLGQIKLSFFIITGISLGYAVTSQFISIWGLGMIFIFYLIRGIATPVLKDYINRLCESNVRATVLSIRNFVIRIIFAVISPLLGYLNDKINLSTALLSAGITFFVLSLITLGSLKIALKKNS